MGYQRTQRNTGNERMTKIYDIGNGIKSLSCNFCGRIPSILGHRVGCPNDGD